MAKQRLVDKPCIDCGVLMIGVQPMRQRCPECAKKRNKEVKESALLKSAVTKCTGDTESPLTTQMRNTAQGVLIGLGITTAISAIIFS